MAHAPRSSRPIAHLAIAVGLVLGARAAAAQPAPAAEPEPAGDSDEAEPLFYRGQDYGSESQFTPANVIVNVGFASLGRFATTPTLGDVDFGDNLDALIDAYVHPVRAVQESYPDGVTDFLVFELKSPANYFLHVVGEGMLSRKLTEWYEARGIDGAWATALGIGTVVIAQQLNEVVEVTVPENPTSELVADLVWNAAGLVAFSFDGVARLFADTPGDDPVQMYYWPGQPVIDVRDGAIYNHGESYLFRATLGAWTSWKLAVQAGIPYLGAGVSIPLDADDTVTVLPIAYAEEVKHVGYEVPVICHGRDTDPPGVDCPLVGEWSVNASWDRAGSLMASAAVHTNLRALNINVYPGVVDLGRVDVGAYAILDLDDASAVGLTLSYVPVVPGARW